MKEDRDKMLQVIILSSPLMCAYAHSGIIPHLSIKVKRVCPRNVHAAQETVGDTKLQYVSKYVLSPLNTVVFSIKSVYIWREMKLRERVHLLGY